MVLSNQTTPFRPLAGVFFPTVFQNEILALNCSFRGWLAMVVTVPKAAESMFNPGAAKCTALLMLNASAWNASLTCSRI